jgi:hypothetical protein
LKLPIPIGDAMEQLKVVYTFNKKDGAEYIPTNCAAPATLVESRPSPFEDPCLYPRKSLNFVCAIAHLALVPQTDSPIESLPYSLLCPPRPTQNP